MRRFHNITCESWMIIITNINIFSSKLEEFAVRTNIETVSSCNLDSVILEYKFILSGGFIDAQMCNL